MQSYCNSLYYNINCIFLIYLDIKCTEVFFSTDVGLHFAQFLTYFTACVTFLCVFVCFWVFLLDVAGCWFAFHFGEWRRQQLIRWVSVELFHLRFPLKCYWKVLIPFVVLLCVFFWFVPFHFKYLALNPKWGEDQTVRLIGGWERRLLLIYQIRVPDRSKFSWFSFRCTFSGRA